MEMMRLIGTTNASGAVTIDGENVVLGVLLAVEWIDGDLTDGVDAVLSCQSTISGVAQTILTLTDANNDAWYYPRSVVHSEAGAALTGTSGGDRTPFILNGKPRLAITSGGDTHTGGCYLYYAKG